MLFLSTMCACEGFSWSCQATYYSKNAFTAVADQVCWHQHGQLSCAGQQICTNINGLNQLCQSLRSLLATITGCANARQQSHNHQLKQPTATCGQDSPCIVYLCRASHVSVVLSIYSLFRVNIPTLAASFFLSCGIGWSPQSPVWWLNHFDVSTGWSML